WRGSSPRAGCRSASTPRSTATPSRPPSPATRSAAAARSASCSSRSRASSGWGAPCPPRRCAPRSTNWWS
ncbi:MAG: hypothetical protein AVDCRST_MAG30-4110, partial [uncultured Solirubrobacteraceae bacterium]